MSPTSALSLGGGCLQSRIGEENPDIFFTDKAGYRNRECLSLGCDDEPLLAGRTPVEVYSDFIEAFSDSFDRMFGALALTSMFMARNSWCTVGNCIAPCRYVITQAASKTRVES